VAGELRPLTAHRQRQIERAVHRAEELTGLQLCVYLGPTGEDARGHAERLFLDAGLHSRPAILVLVAPQARRVEILTAPQVQGRVSDAAAQRAVDRMTARLAQGDLVGGLEAGIAELAAAAGPGAPTGENLPDLLQGS
jgi:uncharacterized membrane protein YgcG